MRKIVNLATLLLFFLAGTASAFGALPETTSPRYLELQASLNSFLEEQKGIYGVYLLDLESGQALNINATETFQAASTYKIPLNLYLYEQIARGNINPGERLTLKEKHVEGGTGRLQEEKTGSKYSIELLSRYSIVYSDNIATNILVSRLGNSNVKDYMHSLGGIAVSSENITCPRDMALYMQELLDFQSRHPELGNKLIGYLKNTIFNERIPRPLPAGIEVAHKIGNWPPAGAYHDIALVEHPRRPYIISVMSKNTPGARHAYSVIREISKMAYDYQSCFQPVKLSFNGTPLKTDTPPTLVNSRVLVPIRVITVSLDASTRWEGKNKTVTITRHGKKIILQIGKKTARINGETVRLDAASRIINSRTMVPVRFVAETLDIKVYWDNKNKTVKLYNNRQ